jgi:UDP-N-acetylglucosamine 4,6-dehydratase (inverting)
MNLPNDINNILITGGTGTLGQALVKTLLHQHQFQGRIVVFSRDEQKQYQMEKQFPATHFPNLRFFIGDIRDAERLRMAMRGIDTVIHAAAMKHVPIAEYNPMECVKTNIIGAENLVNVCLESDVRRVVALSTDKASAPINLYGATKLVSDKLFVAANNVRGSNPIRFSVVRYGNVMGSNGSVIPFFQSHREKGWLPITHEQMTRFSTRIEDGVDLVLYALANSWGGEIWVGKNPSFKVVDLAKAIAPECELRVVGIRPGEKLHEEMITPSDSFYTCDTGKYYSILPFSPNYLVEDYLAHFSGKMVEKGFHYSSENNTEWLVLEDLKKLL